MSGVSFNSDDVRALATVFGGTETTLDTAHGSFTASALSLEHRAVMGDGASSYVQAYTEADTQVGNLVSVLDTLARALRATATTYDEVEAASTVVAE